MILVFLLVTFYSSFNVLSFYSIYPSQHHHSWSSSPSSITSLQSSTLSTSETYCDALGGRLKRISMENEDDGLLASVSVPTFAAVPSIQNSMMIQNQPFESSDTTITQMVEPIGIPGVFQIHNVSPIHQCEDIIKVCEESLHFHTYSSMTSEMKNNHGALQVLVSPHIAQAFTNKIQPIVMNQWNQYISYLSSIGDRRSAFQTTQDLTQVQMIGINRRWRIYRYQPGVEECFLPHIDAAFPPSGLSTDKQTMIWDASTDDMYKEYTNVVSRLTLLLYLNDDFEGGCTNFFVPWIDDLNTKKEYPFALQLLASVQPKAGSILLFPQAVGQEEADYARSHWSLHEGSSVQSGTRGKYVIRSDVIFAAKEL